MTAASKRKGSAFERTIVGAFREAGWTRATRALAGAAEDRGDVEGLPFVVEVKNRREMALAGWVDEANAEAANAGVDAGIVVHKRRGRGDALDSYVTMDLRTFLGLLARAEVTS